MPVKAVFSDEQLARLTRDVLPTDATDGEKVVVFDFDQDGAKVVATFRSRPSGLGMEQRLQWEFQAAAQHDWSGDDRLSGRVVLRWGGITR